MRAPLLAPYPATQVCFSEEVYTLLRTSLLDRIHDKEPPIRIQAVVGLSKLCGSEDPDDIDDGEQTATDFLLEVLSSDPAACAPPSLIH